MKRIVPVLFVVLSFFLFAQPTFAQTADVGKIQTFIQSLINVLVTLAGLIATVFIVIGGLGYITSSGNPEHLDRSKKTILYAGLGLVISIGALVISNIVTNLAQTAFGK